MAGEFALNASNLAAFVDSAIQYLPCSSEFSFRAERRKRISVLGSTDVEPGSRARVLYRRIHRMEWKPLSTAPFDRELELAVSTTTDSMP